MNDSDDEIKFDYVFHKFSILNEPLKRYAIFEY